MLDVYFTAKFKRDFKRMKKQGKNINALLDIVDVLAEEKPLDPRHKDHALTGKYTGQRECHIQPDWLLIYEADGNALILTLTRTGSHSELF